MTLIPFSPVREASADEAPEGTVEAVRTHMAALEDDLPRLDRLFTYLHGRQRNPAIPETGVPEDVVRMARMSRVNILKLVIGSVSQALYVDGYRQSRAAEDAPVWATWQANRMDARQVAVHRAALTYGAAYVTVLPSTQGVKIRGHSPRRFVALYGRDDDFPRSAVRIDQGLVGFDVQLLDDRAIHEFRAPLAKTYNDVTRAGSRLEYVGSRPHGYDVCPVVRFLNEEDLDGQQTGEIDQLLPIQDQIDYTTFDLLVAQQYAAFRQRWIVGWTADSEAEKLKAGASRLWTFEDLPDSVKIGEFDQTDLGGYLDSREASIRHAAALSQTPAHELMGQMVNLSAEALVAAEASQRRKITERQVSFGESWEAVLRLAAATTGEGDAQVRWRDTESRALAQTVDALGKMAAMLSIPPQELWERIPGVSQQDIERWKATFAEADAMSNLTALLDQQAAGIETPAPEAAG